MFADEAAFFLLPSVLRTWAKRGQTPILRATTRREHLSVASAISLEGRLVSTVQEKAFNGEGVVAFLKHLLRQVPGKTVLVWDGATIHHCQAVKEFLATGAAKRLRLIRLPAYAPQLNPAEGVWRWLKRSLGNVCCEGLHELRYELGLAIQRLRRRPEILKSFFAWASLPI